MMIRSVGVTPEGAIGPLAVVLKHSGYPYWIAKARGDFGSNDCHVRSVPPAITRAAATLPDG